MQLFGGNQNLLLGFFPRKKAPDSAFSLGELVVMGEKVLAPDWVEPVEVSTATESVLPGFAGWHLEESRCRMIRRAPWISPTVLKRRRKGG